MTTFPDELVEEWTDTCEHIDVFFNEPETMTEGSKKIGVIVRCADEGFMAIECGQSPDGTGFVTVRRFDNAGEAINVAVVEVDGSVLITG